MSQRVGIYSSRSRAETDRRVSDDIDHPAYYNTGSIEVIDFIEDQHLPFHLASAVKYITRAGRKDPATTVQDLEKGIWYLRRYIDHVLTKPSVGDRQSQAGAYRKEDRPHKPIYAD